VGDLIGTGSAQEQTVVGETPNLAARLQAETTPGTIAIDPTTHRLLGGLFEYRDLGGIEAKGFANRVQAYAVVRPRPNIEEVPRKTMAWPVGLPSFLVILFGGTIYLLPISSCIRFNGPSSRSSVMVAMICPLGPTRT
jgi:hypothetical protein